MDKNRDNKGRFVKNHKEGFKKKYTPWNKDKKCPILGVALKGKKQKKETVEKRNINRKLSGKWHSEETKRKIGLGNKGKVRTLEVRRKYSITNIGFCSGEKHPNWKGGISLLRDKLRNSGKYNLWRLGVFERDKFTCRKCKVKGGILEAHHKKSFSKLILENNIKSFRQGLKCAKLWEIKNGITYCIKCHSFVDSFRNRITKLFIKKD